MISSIKIFDHTLRERHFSASDMPYGIKKEINSLKEIIPGEDGYFTYRNETFIIIRFNKDYLENQNTISIFLLKSEHNIVDSDLYECLADCSCQKIIKPIENDELAAVCDTLIVSEIHET